MITYLLLSQGTIEDDDFLFQSGEIWTCSLEITSLNPRCLLICKFISLLIFYRKKNYHGIHHHPNSPAIWENEFFDVADLYPLHFVSFCDFLATDGTRNLNLGFHRPNPQGGPYQPIVINGVFFHIEISGVVGAHLFQPRFFAKRNNSCVQLGRVTWRYIYQHIPPIVCFFFMVDIGPY